MFGMGREVHGEAGRCMGADGEAREAWGIVALQGMGGG